MPAPMLAITAALLVAALMPPTPRVMGFIAGGCVAGGAAAASSPGVCGMLPVHPPATTSPPAAPPQSLPFLPRAAFFYWHRFASGIMATEIALYMAGAAAFLRNGGHSR